ncbi:MAG: flagellar biosynthetic protein FliO [Pyrinomonadaceae bacterium]
MHDCEIWNLESGIWNYLESGLNFIGVLVQTLVALGAVCGLAYVIFRVVLPRLQNGQNSSGMIRVVERIGVDPKRSLLVIEVAGKWLLIGVSEGGIQMVSELDEIDATAAESQILLNRAAQFQKIDELRSSFAAKLAGVMGRKEIKRDVDNQPKKKKQFDWTHKK